jgi:hypothetical protein
MVVINLLYHKLVVLSSLSFRVQRLGVNQFALYKFCVIIIIIIIFIGGKQHRLLIVKTYHL